MPISRVLRATTNAITPYTPTATDVNTGDLTRDRTAYRKLAITPIFTPYAPGAVLFAGIYTRRSTSAEFLLPNAMQLATACSISSRRPAVGT